MGEPSHACFPRLQQPNYPLLEDNSLRCCVCRHANFHGHVLGIDDSDPGSAES